MCGWQRDRRVARTRTVQKLRSTKQCIQNSSSRCQQASVEDRGASSRVHSTATNWYECDQDTTAVILAVLLGDKWLPRQTHSPAGPGSSCKFPQAHLLIVCACCWCVHCVNGCCTRQRQNCSQQRGCQPVNECDLLWELHNSTARQHMVGSNRGCGGEC